MSEPMIVKCDHYRDAVCSNCARNLVNTDAALRLLVKKADTLVDAIQDGIFVTEGGPHDPTREALCAIVKAAAEYRETRRETGSSAALKGREEK